MPTNVLHTTNQQLDGQAGGWLMPSIHATHITSHLYSVTERNIDIILSLPSSIFLQKLETFFSDSIRVREMTLRTLQDGKVTIFVSR